APGRCVAAIPPPAILTGLVSTRLYSPSTWAAEIFAIRMGLLGPAARELCLNIRLETFKAAVKQCGKKSERETDGRDRDDAVVERSERGLRLRLALDVSAEVKKPHGQSAAQASTHFDTKCAADRSQ